MPLLCFPRRQHCLLARHCLLLLLLAVPEQHVLLALAGGAGLRACRRYPLHRQVLLLLQVRCCLPVRLHWRPAGARVASQQPCPCHHCQALRVQPCSPLNKWKGCRSWSTAKLWPGAGGCHIQGSCRLTQGIRWHWSPGTTWQAGKCCLTGPTRFSRIATATGKGAQNRAMHGRGCLTPATYFCSPAQGLRLRRFVDGSSPTGTPAAALAAAEQRSLQAQQTYGQRCSSLSVQLTARSSNTTCTYTHVEQTEDTHPNPGPAQVQTSMPGHTTGPAQ